MTDTTTTCAAGCVITGSHHPDCPGTPCRGCLPRPATDGQLCAWCYRRLTRDLTDAPRLITHLRTIGTPNAGLAPPNDTHTYRDPAFQNVLPAPWLAADELHAQIASWVLLFLEQHPLGPRMTGPRETGAWHTLYGATVGLRDTTTRTTVEITRTAPIRDSDGQPIEYVHHLRTVTVNPTTNPTGSLVTWLEPHLPWISDQPWAADMRRELADTITTARGRWPTADDAEPARPVAVPCPRCDRLSLTYTPPRYARQAFRVECDNPDCARVFSEDEWERFKALALNVRRGKVSA